MKGNRILRICHRSFRCVTFIAISCLLSAVSQAAEPAHWSQWFKLLPKAADSWRTIDLPGDSLRVMIQRKAGYWEDQAKKQVFVLFSKKSSAYNTAMYKILGIFEEKNIPSEFTLYNFNKNPDIGRQAAKFAKDSGFDLIFSMGSSSTAFLHSNFQDESIPVVSVTSKDPVLMGQMPNYNSGSGNNFAYTSLNMPIPVQMTYLLELKPDLKNIAVLYARNNVSAVVTQVEPLRRLAEEKGIRIIDVVVEDQSRAQQELTRIVPATVAEIGKSDPEWNNSIFWITGSTSVFREIATINKHSGRIPVLSVVPDVVKEGKDSAVLSIGISFESNAHLAAIYGVRILKNEVSAGELKVGIVSPPDISINFHIARRIGLKIPFSFFESANFIYDYNGKMVRENGLTIVKR